ncbi:hypothetical protein AC579_2766 [Pseudocercospora musae]|uniref:Uncharacterized protein n=1 Tax=Pseudocercospora musae TaxID=113226 RepID=A0A139IHT2_9PEZI|nr:hypothetical protein AC579_2766 [Pseudocercospora musae]
MTIDEHALHAACSRPHVTHAIAHHKALSFVNLFVYLARPGSTAERPPSSPSNKPLTAAHDLVSTFSSELGRATKAALNPHLVCPCLSAPRLLDKALAVPWLQSRASDFTVPVAFRPSALNVITFRHKRALHILGLVVFKGHGKLHVIHHCFHPMNESPLSDTATDVLTMLLLVDSNQVESHHAHSASSIRDWERTMFLFVKTYREWSEQMPTR